MNNDRYENGNKHEKHDTNIHRTVITFIQISMLNRTNERTNERMTTTTTTGWLFGIADVLFSIGSNSRASLYLKYASQRTSHKNTLIFIKANYRNGKIKKRNVLRFDFNSIDFNGFRWRFQQYQMKRNETNRFSFEFSELINFSFIEWKSHLECVCFKLHHWESCLILLGVDSFTWLFYFGRSVNCQVENVSLACKIESCA